MLETYRIEAGKLDQADVDLATVFVYTAPDPSTCEEIASTFDIDLHTIQSALDTDEISRFEQDGSDIHLIWRYPESVTTESGRFNFAVSAMGVFYVQGKIVVVRSRPRNLIENRLGMSIQSELDCLLHILNGTIHHYMKHLEVIKMIYREIQSKITEDRGNSHLVQMISLSESLVYYLNAIQANTVVIQRLKRFFDKNCTNEDLEEFLDDIGVDNSQCYQQASTYSQILAGLIDAQASLININMSSVMKNLTTINIIFLPLNLLASIGGMSEYSMMTSKLPWQLSYSLFFVGLTIIGTIMWLAVEWRNFGVKRGEVLRKVRRWPKIFGKK